jgi:predicted NBD/HSP70 family sugar kinase
MRVADNIIRDILRRADHLDHSPFAVGIAILPFRLVGVITDMRGTKLGVGRWELTKMDVDQVVERVAALARYLVKTSLGFDLPHPRIRIGLQIGGPVDTANGVVLLYRNPQIEAANPRAEDAYEWRDVPLAALVEETTGCPTVVDNDAHAFAAYELRFGTDLDMSSFVLILLNDGVGAGVVLDQKLLAAPMEFGHLRIWDPGRPCKCGNSGCIDAHAGCRAITSLVASATGRVGAASIEQAVEIADRQDDMAALALPVFANAGESIARGAADMLTLFGPTHLVLYAPEILIDTGGKSPAASSFMEAVNKFTEYAYPIVRGCRLVPRPLNRHPYSERGAQGAALIALHRYFHAPLGLGRSEHEYIY